MKNFQSKVRVFQKESRFCIGTAQKCERNPSLICGRCCCQVLCSSGAAECQAGSLDVALIPQVILFNCLCVHILYVFEEEGRSC